MNGGTEIRMPLGRSWLLSGPVLCAAVMTISNLVGWTQLPWSWVVATAFASWILLGMAVGCLILMIVLSFLIKWTSLPLIIVDVEQDRKDGGK